MPSNLHQVKTYLDDREKAHLDQLAAQLRLKRSDLLRRLVLAQRLPKPEDFVAYQGIRDLLKVNADLARLGNLFKMAIEEAPDDDLVARLEALAVEIADTQATLKAAARDVHALVRRGGS